MEFKINQNNHNRNDRQFTANSDQSCARKIEDAVKAKVHENNRSHPLGSTMPVTQSTGGRTSGIFLMTVIVATLDRMMIIGSCDTVRPLTVALAS